MIPFKTLLCLSALVLPGAAYAQQPPNIDAECPIPYVVGRQQTVLQAYARVTGAIGTNLPIVGNLSGASLEALKATVRNIIAGEANQALLDVRNAYLCRIRRVVPAAKRASAEALIDHLTEITAGAMVPENWATMQQAMATHAAFRTIRAQPIPGFDDVPEAQRVTRAEIMAAVGNPDFRSRTETRLRLEVRAGALGAGACRGTVTATLATVDNATIGALGAHHAVLADLSSRDTKGAAYSRILVDAQSIVQPTSVTAVITSLQAAPNRTELQGCLTTVAEEVSPTGAPATGTAGSGAAAGAGVPATGSTGTSGAGVQATGAAGSTPPATGTTPPNPPAPPATTPPRPGGN